MSDPIYITEEELEYLTNVPNMINEDNIVYSSEEKYNELLASGNFVSLDDFFRMWEESIDRIMPDP